MTSSIPDRLFVLELANNHMGDLAHGLSVIRQFGTVCRDFPEFHFAFKLQYRDLDSFIHPAMRGRDDIKYVKRFSETRLSREQFDQLVACMREEGFRVLSTPFDEPSVDLIEAQNLDFIKIASCSFTDWPLLERVVASDKPIIASTAGASLEDIDRVVSFLAHRNKTFTILHCVGEYPTPDARLNLNQIDFLQARYPGVPIGFSTHEDPDHHDIVKLAVAKGARLFEKHVGVATAAYPLNAYSASPEQLRRWLEAARSAYLICGVADTRLPPDPVESASLRSLRRGIFARRALAAGETLCAADIYFAFPPVEGQYTANDWSKYASFTPTQAVAPDAPLLLAEVQRRDIRAEAWDAAQKVKAMLAEYRISVPGGVDLELSHHYGIERFHEFGLTLLTIVNRGYCKKLLVCLPGQRHPEQFHRQKEETFHILHGEVELTLNGQTQLCRAGEVVHIEPEVRHEFFSHGGAIIEEISSTHFANDSFYTDPAIHQNANRKTLLTYWMV